MRGWSLPKSTPVYEGVREFESRAIVLSLHHRKEGWLRHQEKFRAASDKTHPWWFTFCLLIGKPPRLRCQRMLRSIFLVAQPPLLAVMQGGDYCTPLEFIHSCIGRPFRTR